MLSRRQWRQVDPGAFEELSIEHVRDIYPDFTWRTTRVSQDGGKDAVGTAERIGEELVEIYWMEAKHKPGQRSIGKYTLDTHLVSTFFSGGKVKRLHVVTSGALSRNFLLRAAAFGAEHRFSFSYSDAQTLECWLASRPELIRAYFGANSAKIKETLAEVRGQASRQIFARAFLLPDNDSFGIATTSTTRLLPGRKFTLVITLSLAESSRQFDATLWVKWLYPVKRVSLLVEQQSREGLVTQFRVRDDCIISLPFRLLRYSREPLPDLSIHSADGTELARASLKGISQLPSLSSPFVGSEARRQLLYAHKVLTDEVLNNRPALAICQGRAGSGKSRLAEELRDDAQRLGFSVRTLEMTADSRAQEGRWRQLFRWIFGLEHNPFELAEERLLGKRLQALDLNVIARDRIEDCLRRFLILGDYDEDLFDLSEGEGACLADAVTLSLIHRLLRPALIHVDDVHHLTRHTLGPLYLLHHLVEIQDTIPLCIILTARDDETVLEKSFEHFVTGLDLAESARVHFLQVKDLTHNDARELVASTLRWPELLAEESRTLGRILERAGYNPFSLMQTLNHLVFDGESVAFGHGDTDFLVDIPAFKKVLGELPHGVRKILERRFSGLLSQRGGRRLLLSLCAIAVVGRRAPLSVLRRALGESVDRDDLSRLMSLGYLVDATTETVELSHDLLVEALTERSELKDVAISLAESLNSGDDGTLSEEERESIFFFAGPDYFSQAWKLGNQLAEAAFGRQEYPSVTRHLWRLERISKNSSTYDYGVQLQWWAAIADQHCGNTQSALGRFARLKEAARADLREPDGLERYVEAAIEIGNQHYLRAEPSAGVCAVEEALDILTDEHCVLSRPARNRLLAFAYNRYGAILHLADRHEEAEDAFLSAIRSGELCKNEYLVSHTHWNLASLLRFRAPERASDHLMQARTIWTNLLGDKERFRVMLECSEAYSQARASNSRFTRACIYAVAAEAAAKGYLFQSCGALLCFSCCAIEAESWEDARTVLFKTIDITTLSEDLKSRLFATHYLSIVAHNTSDAIGARDWCWQAAEGLSDPLLKKSTLGQCILRNYQITANQAVENPEPLGQQTAGEMVWFRFDRA